MKTIDSGARREIAEMLRVYADDWREVPALEQDLDEDELDGIRAEIAGMCGIGDMGRPSEMASLMADLIDRPACCMKPSEEGVGLRQWECGACGGLTVAGGRPLFCSRCGAEVRDE